jgi:hypothetical protein
VQTPRIGPAKNSIIVIKATRSGKGHRWLQIPAARIAEM